MKKLFDALFKPKTSTVKPKRSIKQAHPNLDCLHKYVPDYMERYKIDARWEGNDLWIQAQEADEVRYGLLLKNADLRNVDDFKHTTLEAFGKIHANFLFWPKKPMHIVEFFKEPLPFSVVYKIAEQYSTFARIELEDDSVTRMMVESEEDVAMLKLLL